MNISHLPLLTLSGFPRIAIDPVVCGGRPVVAGTCMRERGAQVVVATVMTQPPRAGDAVVEMPAAVRAHLGLCEARCWIVASEVNSFIWPGPDLRPVGRTGNLSSHYGEVPGELLRQSAGDIPCRGAANYGKTDMIFAMKMRIFYPGGDHLKDTLTDIAGCI